MVGKAIVPMCFFGWLCAAQGNGVIQQGGGELPYETDGDARHLA